ncbi:unnamed protein product [Durusdinium trenchii]|uniref:CS domain-containing protein n=1 Tax=Durusdinium trenchii TaxID=1381693 RepID=A0ABP0MS04_9DINO
MSQQEASLQELGAALVAGPANEPGLHPTDFERISDQESDGADVSKEALRIDCSYREAEKTCQQRLRSEAVDVDGWKLEKSQMELVEESEEDLQELKILLSCCQHEKNRQRLHAAIKEFEVKLRTRRTWAWFPLPRFQWSGFEYEKPCILLDFHVPGVGSLPPEDVHCDFGVDWFDLKVWNVKWSVEDAVRYHHRVKKTRLLRDIVPSESSVEAQGDHLLVKLQKALDPRHGYCAWSDLTAGSGRKPFKYQEDAPDGGLMDFLEGEYEKYEGHEGFRKDLGKAMEQVHRNEPVRGFED